MILSITTSFPVVPLLSWETHCSRVAHEIGPKILPRRFDLVFRRLTISSGLSDVEDSEAEKKNLESCRLSRAVGLFERVTTAQVHEGLKKEYDGF
ncbi:hypothetical protein B5X24_HaOG204596 [Helicoverpa armigera]|nr:hypothetical protein B5X24_HaOG204596 [Helicoverpa armigera]